MGLRIEPKFYAQILHQCTWSALWLEPNLKRLPNHLGSGTHTIRLIIIIIIKIGKTSPKIEIVNYKFENEVILKVSNARSERKKLEKIIRFFIFDFSCETKNID
jgi:hypothetical protein